ncbi:hypothetical protein [Flavobacterium sp.]|uniref:hypothetical protein n=1 Tax=Flavobacterium sp. TaxID=239 RepID=UPI00261125BC|nr:hypothetical protein [Flavobacterium sp.]
MKEIVSVIKQDYSGYFFKRDLRNLLIIRKTIRRFLLLCNIDVILLINNYITLCNTLNNQKVYNYFTHILNKEEIMVLHSITNYLNISSFDNTNRIMDDLLQDLHDNYIRYRLDSLS